MISDAERREIARKLRAAAVYLPNDIDSEDLEMAIATTVCNYDVPNVETLLNRLADLIEPTRNCSEPTRTYGECDRDVLLELVDELERPMRDGGYSKRIARRIRKALGVDDGA